MNFKTAEALVFIAKAIINTILYLQNMISKEIYESRIRDMSDQIYKATHGPLNDRLEAGQQIENQINRHAP